MTVDVVWFCEIHLKSESCTAGVKANLRDLPLLDLHGLATRAQYELDTHPEFLGHCGLSPKAFLNMKVSLHFDCLTQRVHLYNHYGIGTRNSFCGMAMYGILGPNSRIVVYMNPLGPPL